MAICSNCKTGVLKEGHTRCNACMAEYMREYRELTKARLIQRYRREGADAMRVLIVQILEERIGVLELDGHTAAQIIRDVRLD